MEDDVPGLEQLEDRLLLRRAERQPPWANSLPMSLVAFPGIDLRAAPWIRR
jgi:hypothetical protein